MLKILILGLSVLLAESDQSSELNEVRFNDLLDKLESDVLGFARELEQLHVNKCNKTTLQSCNKENYLNCDSSLPNLECPGGSLDPEYHVTACGEVGSACSGSWDFTTSNVRFPVTTERDAIGQPTDPLMIEEICYTRDMDSWFHEKKVADEEYWRSLEVGPRHNFYATQNGLVRIFPGRHAGNCFIEPRLRPWYSAASDGMKNIVLVLDTSLSMAFGDRLSVLKQAAKRVVRTATGRDRLAVVVFDGQGATSLSVDGASLAVSATSEAKSEFYSQIDALEIDSESSIQGVPVGSNYSAGFEKAFQVLEDSSRNSKTVACNSAVLFMTGGVEMEGAPSKEQTKEMVLQRTSEVSDEIGHPTALFTFTLAASADSDSSFLQELACESTIGVWSEIMDEDDLEDGVAPYYHLFATNLEQYSENYVAWVEPYLFATTGALATTVAAPVYDRTVEGAPRFLGAAAIGIGIRAMDAALGIDSRLGGSDATIARFVRSANKFCPSLQLTACQMESFRYQANSDQSYCINSSSRASCNSSSNSTVYKWKESQCPADVAEFYPEDIWNNRDTKDMTHTERVCCRVGEPADTWDSCPIVEDDDDFEGLGLLLGIGAGVLCAMILVGVGLYVFKGQQQHDSTMETGSHDTATETKSDRFVTEPGRSKK